jgi:hypothetical protein
MMYYVTELTELSTGTEDDKQELQGQRNISEYFGRMQSQN